jgi:hypothetical protein
MEKAEMLAQRFASPDEAFAAIEAAGLNKADFKAIPDQGEFLLIEREKPQAQAPKPAKAGKAKAAKGEGKGKAAKAAPAPIGGRSKADRAAAKAAKPAEAKPDFSGPWHKLSDRKWIGPWADRKAEAEKGKLIDAGSAKADLAGCEYGKAWQEMMEAPFAGIFAANTHWPFRKRIAALAALIRAKDEKGLKALQINEISTTPNMLGKLRDLSIAALAAKAAKPAKQQKAANGNGAAPEAPAPSPQG